MTTKIDDTAASLDRPIRADTTQRKPAGLTVESPKKNCPVVILCGGMGTRIADVSKAVPKPLLPIGGMPILWHIMKSYSHEGFRDFILCLGHLGEVIEDFFSLDGFYDEAFAGLGYKSSELCERREPGWNITFARTGETTPTGGRLKCVETLIDSDEFMLTYGDGLADVALESLREFHQQQMRIATVTGVRPRSSFGVLEVENGLAKSFIEKPLLDHRVNGGFFTFRREIFDYVRMDEALEELPLKRIVERGELAVYEHDGFWTCMDTRKDFDALNAMWCEGKTPWKRW